MSQMRRHLVVLLLALAAIVLFWRMRDRTVAVRDASRDAGETATPSAPRPTPAESRAARDALREKIVRRLDERSARDAGAASAVPAPAAATQPRPPGDLRDRIGGRDALLRQLNHDFMPLADECIEQAQERSPGLAGMLAIDMETLFDAELGAIVEVAEPSSRNEIADPLLFECIRESAYSLSLPPPPASGRDRFMLTIPVAPPRDAGI